MALKISQLNPAAYAGAADVLPMERAAVNYSLTATQIAALSQQAISLRDPKYGVHADGVTDDTAAIASFVTDVNGSAHKRGYIPAGTYAVTGTAALTGLISVNSDNVEIFGDGMGLTTIKQIVGGGGGGGTLTSNYVVVYLNAKGGKVHDLTIQADRSASGGSPSTWRFIGIQSAQGSSFSEIDRVEILNVYGSWTDGGHAIHLEQGWNSIEYSTTLTASHASGTQTYTVASMAGIYPGRRLWINSGGGSAENVLVTATTSTSFTAVFASAHNSGETVQIYFGGKGYHQVKDCFIHDCQQGTGILVAANNCSIIRNRFVNVGGNGNMHALYVTQGHNLFERNEAYGTAGYSFHQHVGGSQDFTSSGNRWIGNLSQDPVTCHMICDSTVMTGSDPDYPGTEDGSRYTTIIGNTFRCTKARVLAGNPPAGVRMRSMPAVIIGNTFDDTAGGGAGFPWLDTAESGSSPKPCIVAGNRFIQTNMTYANTSNQTVVMLGDGIGTIIEGNYFNPNDSQGAGGTYVIAQASGLAANTVCVNNTVDGSCSTDTSIGAVFARGGPCRGNRVNLTAGACCLALTGEEIAGNFFKNGGAIQTFAGTETCSFHDNEIDSSSYLAITSGSNTLQIYNNNGYICYAGKTTSNAYACDRLTGALMTFPKSTNTLSKGKLVKLSSGNLLTMLTTDTTWLGVPVCDTDAVSNNTYIAGRVGTEIQVLVDANSAFTAGHVAIASPSVAGAVRDNGTSVPTAPASYGIFLNSGSASTVARVLVLKNSVGGTT